MLTVAFAPLIMVAGEPLRRCVIAKPQARPARLVSHSAAVPAGHPGGDDLARPPGPAQVFWRRPRFWLLVGSNPLWIALTAPARWLLGRASRFGHRAGVALRPPGCGSHGGRNQACQAVPWRRQNRAPSRSFRACPARPCADRTAERTAKRATAAAPRRPQTPRRSSAQPVHRADRTARRSGPHGGERRMHNAPVPPIGAASVTRVLSTWVAQIGCSVAVYL